MLPRFWCRIEAQVLKITIGNASLSAVNIDWNELKIISDVNLLMWES